MSVLACVCGWPCSEDDKEDGDEDEEATQYNQTQAQQEQNEQDQEVCVSASMGCLANRYFRAHYAFR